MTKKLFIGLFLVCFVLVPIAYLKADSGRESKQLPPQEVEIMYSSEDHAYQAKDISDVVRWKILPDGTMVTLNPSGVTVSTTGAGGIAFLSGSTGTVAATSVGWTLTPSILSTYDTFMVDTSAIASQAGSDNCVIGIDHTAGVTIYLTGCLTNTVNGKTLKFINSFGTTPFVLYDANGRFNGTTGTTENPTVATARAPEDQGDTIIVKAISTPSGTSGWYVESFKLND